ncbi:MAG: WG repeat-containing protein, partial [Bacteroidota bacterium]
VIPLMGWPFSLTKRQRPFGEGLAAVRLDSGAWNFIDSSGQVLQQWEKGKYQDFRSFSEGLCAFRKGARWGFIDQNFKEVLPPIYKKVEPFYLGRAVVTTDQGVGLIDSTGAFIMDPVSFRSISSFNKHGLALASNRRNEHFLVDTSGQVRLPQALQDAELEGTPPYPIQMNGRWGFVDSLGSISIYPAYGEVKRFNSGLAIIRKSVGGPGYWLKQNGQLLNERRYDRIFNFDRGLAVVGKQGHANYLINTKGQKVPLLRGTPLWMDGELIGTEIDGKQFYSDHTGNLAFPQSFDKIHPFNKSETAIVAIKGKKGLIDQRGMLLIQPKYAFLERIPNSDIYEAGPPAFGIYGTNGQLLIPVEFDDIVLLEGDRFRVERGEKVGYLDTEGKVIWPLQN